MIKRIFFPEKINSYYLFSKRIVAFEVTTTAIHATLLRAHRKKRFILGFFTERYSTEDEGSLSAALQKILNKIGNYDESYITLPSTNALFKNLNVPFTTYKKIKLILPFEVDQKLPFALEDAYFDAIITSTDLKNNSSQIFFAAVTRKIINHYLKPFLSIGIKPHKVTLNTLEMYGLVKELSKEIPQNGTSIILDLNEDSSNITVLRNGFIESIRTLPYGIDKDSLQGDLNSENGRLKSIVYKIFTDTKFTIDAILKNETLHGSIRNIIFSGPGSQINDLADHAQNFFSCPCTIFHAHTIVHNESISLEQGISIPLNAITSLATALSHSTTENFNLVPQYREKSEHQILTKQLIVAGSLIAALFVSLSLYSFFTLRSIKQEIEAAKKQVVQRLTREFNLSPTRGRSQKSLASIINTTRQKLLTEESIWFALSTANRFAFLQYLQELSTRINRPTLGLTMKRITIKSDERNGEDSMSLEGSVRDYDALRKFEEDLQDSLLFVSIPKLQETKFNISLVIDKKKKGDA